MYLDLILMIFDSIFNSYHAPFNKNNDVLEERFQFWLSSLENL